MTRWIGSILAVAILAVVTLVVQSGNGGASDTPGVAAGASAAPDLTATGAAQIDVTNSDTPAISVAGTGKVLVTPDIARVTLGVEVRNVSLAAAQTEATQQMNAVLDMLKQSSIDAKDIQTVQYNVQPLFRHNDQDGTTQSEGFLVTHLVSVTFRDLSSLGPVLDKSVQMGASRINSLQFDVADPSAAVRQAREQAVADARARADHLAQLTGVTLGRPLSIVEGSGPVVPLPAQRAMPASDAAAPRIEPGQTEVQVTVQILYAIQ